MGRIRRSRETARGDGRAPCGKVSARDCHRYRDNANDDDDSQPESIEDISTSNSEIEDDQVGINEVAGSGNENKATSAQNSDGPKKRKNGFYQSK